MIDVQLALHLNKKQRMGKSFLQHFDSKFINESFFKWVRFDVQDNHISSVLKSCQTLQKLIIIRYLKLRSPKHFAN